MKQQGSLNATRANKDEMALRSIHRKPKYPPELEGDVKAKEIWVITVELLYELGILSAAHVPSLAAYCVEMSKYYLCLQTVREEGMYQTARTGYVSPHPAITIGNTSLNNAMKMGAKFGLYPSDTHHISVGNTISADSEDDFE